MVLAVATLAVLLCLGACQPAPEALDSSAAESTMRGYFLALSQGRYADAVARYSGAYAEPLISMNPDIDPADRARLFERYCTQNGGVCLPVKDVIRILPADIGFIFTVHFANPDGSTFAQGPCCGETTGEPITEFDVFVSTIGDDSVLTLPPYVP
jgi:hypothetical protein